ncbi:phage tail tape measure protein [Streptomyces sp. NPDC015237]|uniref:phage tail tape measure protein n=1 Tax=Streptomyces sp. NPDC015237 TaxID=3364949 RepID=UPI0036FB1AEA
MALTVGELTAILAIDDRAVDPSLRRAENAMRTAGQRMGDDAQRAGDDAGQQLGDGIVRGIDGRLRDARGRFVAAGRRAGDAVGDGLGDGVGDGADQAVDQAGGKLDRLKQVAGGAAMAAGAAAGMMLLTAFNDAMDQAQITAKLRAQLDATGPEAKRYGQIAGQLFTEAIVTDFQQGADTISGIASSGLLPPGATNAQIKSIATNAADLANTFDVEVSLAAQAAGAMLKNGLAKDGKQAFDLLAKGMTGLGPASEDLMETFTEYGPIFKSAGISGQTALGLIKQAIQGGWTKDTDKIGDAFKELQLRATEGSKGVQDAFKSMGLDAKQVGDDIAAGGKRGEKALDLVLDTLNDMGPETQGVKQIVSTLFGGPGEDLGAALFALDVDKASEAMGGAAGSADRLGNSLRDNAGTKVEAFKRGLQQGVVNFLGGPVLGSIDSFKKKIGGIWTEAGQQADGTAFADKIVAFFPILGQKLAAKALELAPKIIGGISSAGQRVAEWIMANPASVLKVAAIAGAITLALVALPALAAAAISTAAIALMVGFVSRLLSALGENLPRWWNSFTNWVSAKASEAGNVMDVLGGAIGSWFSGLWSRYIAGPVSRQWNSFIGGVQALPGRASNALGALGGLITARANAAWTSFRNASVSRAMSMVSWVKGLPSRISAGMGSLTGLLTGKGRNVVQGLWNGIQSMGGWIKSKLIGWAKSMVPGPIAKALGIASPSKVTKEQGRWIARGLIDGLTGSSKQVRAASYKLVDIVRDSLSGKKEKKALQRINRDAGWLDWLAQREAKVATQLKAAQKKLSDLVKERDKLAADVKKGVLDEANITKQDTGGFQSADNILMNLREDTRAAQEFAKHLDTLKKKGVRSDLIAQIAQAGVTQGAASAAALANASSSQIKQINSQQAALTAAAGKAGSTAGNAMYGAGIQAAQGLVKGLQKQQKTIENTMLKIAKSMTAAIKKSLGIRSPSRVMAQVGAYAALGVQQGIEAERSAVNASMASLVETPSPSAAYAQSALGPGRGRSASLPTYRLTAGDAFGDMVFSTIRQRVGVRGGDVQLVLGKGGR